MRDLASETVLHDRMGGMGVDGTQDCKSADYNAHKPTIVE